MASFKDKVESHPVTVTAIASVVAFGLGWGAHIAVQSAAGLTTVSQERLSDLEKREASKSAQPVPTAARADLELQVYGDNRNPRKLSSFNVQRHIWIRMIGEADDKPSKDIGSLLFVVFKDPVPANSAALESPNIKLPLYEVKSLDSRSTIFFIKGQMPAGTLNVAVR